MKRRYGSCSTIDRATAPSASAACPDCVLGYVLVHELANHRMPGHSPTFWDRVERDPDAARAEGFMEGCAHAAADPHSTGD